MSSEKVERLWPIVERLLGQFDAREAASLFHHGRADDQEAQMGDEEVRMVVTVVPHDEIESPLDLRQYHDALQEPATRIRGIRSSTWGSTGFTFNFTDRELPCLTVHRRGEIELREPHLIEEGGVVGMRVLRPLIGSVEVARTFAGEADFGGPLQVDVSLLGVGGTQFHTPPRGHFHSAYGFDSDRIHQRQVVEADAGRSDEAIYPLAVMLWQSSGFEDCHQYDDEQRWGYWGQHFG